MLGGWEGGKETRSGRREETRSGVCLFQTPLGEANDARSDLLHTHTRSLEEVSMCVYTYVYVNR